MPVKAITAAETAKTVKTGIAMVSRAQPDFARVQ